MGHMRPLTIALLWLWLGVLPEANTFQVLPYVHIDFAHFFRLAQCQAKCTEKYGILATRTLLDGTERRFFNVTIEEYRWCDRGCSHGRLFTKKTRATPSMSAFKDGQTFWLASETDNGTAATSASPVESLELLCVNPVPPDSHDDLLDSLTARIAAILKPDFVAPVRFVVQWKQRVVQRNGVVEETKWITASVEETPLMTAESLQAGVLYQFMVTVVSPTGRLGRGVVSDWLQAPFLGSTGVQPNTALKLRSQFNSDDGVSALLRWPFVKPSRLPTPTTNASSGETLPQTTQVNGRDVVDSLTSCYFQILVESAAGGPVTEVVQKDESDGFLLQKLEYSTEYTVRVRTFVPGDLDVLGRVDRWPLETVYRSVSCSDVHGKGSIECDPEPVEHLSLQVHPANMSVSVSWVPAVDSSKVLLYQLIYAPVADDSDTCTGEQTSQYLSATTTFFNFHMTSEMDCDYELKVVMYDLIGREAVASTLFHIARPAHGDVAQLAQLWVLVAPGAVLVLLCLVVHCARCCCRPRAKRVGEMSKPLAENV